MHLRLFLDPRRKLDAFGTSISLLIAAVGYDYTTYLYDAKYILMNFMLTTIKSMLEFGSEDLHHN